MSTPKISFTLDKPNAEVSHINFTTFINGKKRRISIGEKIPTKFWDKNKQRTKRPTAYPRGTQLNILLNELSKRVDGWLLERKAKEERIRYEDLKEVVKEFFEKSNPNESKGLIPKYDEFLDFKAMDLKEATIKKYKTLRKLLLEFETKKRTKLSFELIDDVFEAEFRHFLNYDLNQKNVTVTRYIEIIKSFMKWSVKRGYTDNRSYEDFDISKTKDRQDGISLTFDEVAKIEGLDLSNNKRLDRVRDKFLFQCYTGQRFSDVNTVKWKAIGLTRDKRVWNLYQIKGNKEKRVNIPMLPQAMKILEKYGAKFDSEVYIFPSISNVKMNEYLKEVCKLAEIDESITKVSYVGNERTEDTRPKYGFVTSHVGRSTFVTLSSAQGMNDEMIMKITGHEDFKTLRIYLNFNDKSVEEDLFKAWIK